MTTTQHLITEQDIDAITYATNDGVPAIGPNQTAKEEREASKSRARLIDAGLAVAAEYAPYNKATGMRSGGMWLTETGWLMRREYRDAAGLPADEVVEHLLMIFARPAGACRLTYAPGVTRKHGES